ncbi:unnamed protein product [Rotaria sp. Silwood1]|nr:unnamed protein product [Rotaria sp. Silwood1]CAF1481414.1 unnamed protein product [Rotaria sp. Silwood1]CAF3578454.1 unnamed protein product [Rotaria sp. Silwood1]
MVIQETVKEVKANQKQCKRLAERIDAITFALKSMDDRALCRLELRKSLDNYRTCIQKCLEFVTQFKDETSWFSKVFKNQNSKEKFEELNLQLTQYATDFNLSINLKQIFDPKLDENDQKTDLDAIQCKLDEIASLMAQRQDEQLRHVKGIEENISQRLNSFKHYLQQNIMKRSDSHRAKDIAEEDSAFLHIPYYDLVREQCIGQGGFADVYRGRWLSQDHEVAIKVIRVQHLNETVRGDFVREIAMMNRVHYDHILNIFGACMEPQKYALIVEYMSLGSLYDLLKRNTLQLTWSDRWSIGCQMIKGINYLHKLPKPIIHRDIKSPNILLKQNGKDFLVKVADFGLAKIRYETSCQSSISHSVGTLIWKAPELLRIERHTEASDVYALGVVLWELGTGCEPYAEADDSTISTFVLRGDRLNIPGTIPHSFAEMISRAWAHEPQNRPTCQQLLSSVKEIRYVL